MVVETGLQNCGCPSDPMVTLSQFGFMVTCLYLMPGGQAVTIMWLPLVTFPASFLKKSVEREGQRRSQIVGARPPTCAHFLSPLCLCHTSHSCTRPHLYAPFPNHTAPLMHFSLSHTLSDLHSIFHSTSQPVQCLLYTSHHNHTTVWHLLNTPRSPTMQYLIHILVHPLYIMLYLSYALSNSCSASHTSLRPSHTLPNPHGSSCTLTRTLLTPSPI